MQDAPPTDRCRLVLVAPPAANDAAADARVLEAVGGGDIASLVLPQYDMEEVAFQNRAEHLVPRFQEAGIAVVLAGEARTAARVGADGLHFEGSKADLATLIGKHQGRMMIGCGGARNRDDALELGETQPDYMFFGRFGYDVQPEPHPRNLKLGAWWAEMVAIPALVLGGNDVASCRAVAETGVDFVALSAAVFGEGVDPAEAVARVNATLDASAPRLEPAR